MKYIIKSLAAIAILALCSCGKMGRIDQPSGDDSIPSQVMIRSVRSISGGAIITYDLPDDVNVRGVRAEYVRNGEKCHVQASVFVDSLTVIGYSDTEPHEVNLYSIGWNDKLSDPIPVSIIPKLGVIKRISFSMSACFGGIRLAFSGNEDHDPLALTIIQDENLDDDGKMPSEMSWTDLYTYHTEAEKATFTRFGLPSTEKIYGVYAKDKWMNCSDTVYVKLAPMEEHELPNLNWKLYYLPGDETETFQDKYPFENLFDGSWADNAHTAAFAYGGPVKTLTIDMGYTASFSRMRFQPRATETKIAGYVPYHWQIWGSMNPNPDGSFDDSWYLLGDFIFNKPSGLGPDGSFGTTTDEDFDAYMNRNDYEFSQSDMAPDPQRSCRYFRIKMLDNVGSYFTVYDTPPTTSYYVIGELLMWGVQK